MKKRGVVILLMLIIFYSVFLILDYKFNQNINLYQQDLSLTGEGPLILNYHRIRSSNSSIKALDKLTTLYTKDSELLLYTIYEDEFKEQLLYLTEKGYHFITPDELQKYLNNEFSIPQKSILITFDDVDVSIYETAYPFLLENKIPFTLFIITGEIGNSDFKGLEMASWEQIKEMKGSGLATIGAHSHQMHSLDKKNNPPFFNKNEIDNFYNDTQLTINTVGEKLGFTPIYYAYPYGFGTPDTDQVLLELGYELVFTLSPGIVKQGESAYFMKRVLVSRSSWLNVVDWVEKR